MAISGVANNSLRDQWNKNGGVYGGTEDVDGTGETGGTHIWDAVFEEQKTGVTADDFLSLMVAQLTNQDFMNPVDDTQYVTQLASLPPCSRCRRWQTTPRPAMSCPWWAKM